MIIRIVRMHFALQSVDTFLSIFDANKQAIRNFQGCTHLQLLKDTNDRNIYTTLSHWNLAADLECYRMSELFASVWVQVKPLFAAQPQAFSLEKFIEI